MPGKSILKVVLPLANCGLGDPSTVEPGDSVLGEVVGLPAGAPTRTIIVRTGRGEVRVGVDEILGSCEVVHRAVGAHLGHLPFVQGAATRASGEPALLLDPTGIVAACQQERSQHKNRATAMKMLKAALYERALAEQEAERAELEATKSDNAFGSQIRSYVFQPYTMVNDHRTELKVSDVSKVMDGALDPFIEAFLKKFGGQSRA